MISYFFHRDLLVPASSLQTHRILNLHPTIGADRYYNKMAGLEYLLIEIKTMIVETALEDVNPIERAKFAFQFSLLSTIWGRIVQDVLKKGRYLESTENNEEEVDIDILNKRVLGSVEFLTYIQTHEHEYMRSLLRRDWSISIEWYMEYVFSDRDYQGDDSYAWNYVKFERH